MTASDSDLEALAVLEDQEEAAAAKRAASIRALKSGITPTPPIAGFTGLSLGDASVWNQAPMFQDDFLKPGAFGNNWSAYPKGWKDTSGKGTYDPARASIADLGNGLVVCRQTVTANSDGTFGGCVLQPASNGQAIYFTDNRYSERVRLTQQDNGHYVLEGWPANNADWESKSGEPDDIEVNTLNNPTLGGWIHVIGDSGDAHKVQITTKTSFADGFHVVTIETMPSKGTWRRYIDNVLTNVILNFGVAATAADKAPGVQLVTLPSGLSIPGKDPLRRVKQLESNGNKPTKGGVIVDTDWVVVQGLK